MAPVDGLVAMKMNTNHPFMTDVNISKNQPFESKGLGAVGGLRSKNAATLKIYFNPQEMYFVLSKQSVSSLRSSVD